ncbi:MAG: hypothetical protein C4567_11015 [Deltaproteobacteria bacterium]|nr:MAG: hypothetical protein C4567_11015 [Deltaproteobacteria bacterium]
MTTLDNLPNNPWRIPWHLLLIFALLSGGILGVGYWYYEHQQDHFREEMEAQLNAVANLKVNQITSWRQERMHDAVLIFDDPIFASEVQEWYDGQAPPGQREEIIHRLQGLKQDMYESIRLLDSRANVQLAIPDDYRELTAFIKEKALSAISGGKIIFSDMHPDPEGRVRLDLIVPIHFQKNGRKINAGVVLLCINPHRQLYPLIESRPTPSSTAEFVLVRHEGREIVYLNELPFRPDAPLNLRLSLDRPDVPAVKAALGNEGIIRGMDYRGIPVMAVTRTIPDSPWFFVAKIDAAEMEAVLREQAIMVGILLIALVATSGVTVAYFWRNRDVQFYRQQEKALKESEHQLRLLSSQLLMVQEKERHRFSMELHDELGQALMVLKFQLHRISKEKRKAKAEFQSLLNYLEDVIEKVRRLSRDLIPASLEEFGLAIALNNLLEEFGRQFEIRWSPGEINGIDRLFSKIKQVNIFRIFQESLTNIARHAQASQITVIVKRNEDRVVFSIEDNGQGFHLREAGGRETGIGLTAMQERARLAGGFLHIRSRSGGGTRISFNIPIDKEEHQDAALSSSTG